MKKKKELKFGLVLGFFKRRKELLTALGNKIFPFFFFFVWRRDNKTGYIVFVH